MIPELIAGLLALGIPFAAGVFAGRRTRFLINLIKPKY